MNYTWYTDEPSKRGKEKWTVEDWVKYAQTPIKSRFTPYSTNVQHIGTLPWSQALYKQWGGGYLSQEDYNYVTWLQQKQLENEFRQKWEEAKQANEQRYQEILSGYQDRYNQAMSSLEGLGDSAKEEIRQKYAIERSKSMQQLLDSGLLTSTVAPAVTRQIAAQESRDLLALNEQLRREKLQYMTGLSGDRLAFMERREDPYPDFQMLIELAKGLGNA